MCVAAFDFLPLNLFLRRWERYSLRRKSGWWYLHAIWDYEFRCWCGWILYELFFAGNRCRIVFSSLSLLLRKPQLRRSVSRLRAAKEFGIPSHSNAVRGCCESSNEHKFHVCRRLLAKCFFFPLSFWIVTYEGREYKTFLIFREETRTLPLMIVICLCWMSSCPSL